MMESHHIILPKHPLSSTHVTKKVNLQEERLCISDIFKMNFRITILCGKINK